MAALPAAVNRLLPFFGFFGAFATIPLILAQRALAPAAILAREARDMRRFFGGFAADEEGIPPPAAIESIWPCSFSICSFMAMMPWS
jgi:hypothetical protein